MLTILGSGLGGYSLAREVRRRDPQRPIRLITADDAAVYAKPMLSTALAQNRTPEALVQKTAAVQAADLGLELHAHSRVIAIDRPARRVVLADGSGFDYQSLVLAVGADPRPWSVPGRESLPADCVLTAVNDLDDYRRWRQALRPGQRILLVGAGLIGCEFANDLAGAGFAVTLADPGPWPLARLLPEALGGLLRRALEQIGVQVLTGCRITRLETAANGLPQAIPETGAPLPFHHALSAIGLIPRTGLAQAAGLMVAPGGIVVDSWLRTPDPHIFALGDCAAPPSGALPFVAPLLAASKALAATLCGTATPLTLPALPVVVKTPALPVVVCPPPAGGDGGWEVDRLDGCNARALFRTPAGIVSGFALTGQACEEQRTLAATLPPWLAAPET